MSNGDQQVHGIEDQAHGGSQNGGDTQESYFANTSFKGVCIRGGKKMVTEMSSIKTLALAGVFALMAFAKLDAMWGIMGVLGLVGAREIDFNQVINIIQSRFGK